MFKTLKIVETDILYHIKKFANFGVLQKDWRFSILAPARVGSGINADRENQYIFMAKLFFTCKPRRKHSRNEHTFMSVYKRGLPEDCKHNYEDFEFTSLPTSSSLLPSGQQYQISDQPHKTELVEMRSKDCNQQLTYRNQQLIFAFLYTTERGKTMHTTATLHVHPAAADPFRIFEIRRLAREYGCSFATTKPKQKARTAPAPFDPNGGGHAA